MYEAWPEFRPWADKVLASSGRERHRNDSGHRKTAATAGATASLPFDPAAAGPPSPAPRQVFAVALNYRDPPPSRGSAPRTTP